MLFKFNTLIRRDYKDDYSPYSFSFDMSQDVDNYPDIIGNISHGTYAPFLMISILRRIAEMGTLGTDEEYEDGDYGLPLNVKSASLIIEDGIEKFGLKYINDDHTHLMLICNDQEIKIRYDFMVEDSDCSSAKIHCGVAAHLKCPTICDYLANKLVIFKMHTHGVEASDEASATLDSLYDDQETTKLFDTYTRGLSLVLAMSKKYDILLINQRESGDIEDNESFEWLYDAILRYKDEYGFKNRFVELNFIRDKDFEVSARYEGESSNEKNSFIDRLKKIHSMMTDNDESEGPIAIPVEDCDDPNEIKAKIKAALEAKGFGMLTNTDNLADQIMSARSSNNGNSGIYFGTISTDPDSDNNTHGISLSAKDINYFLNELHNTNKPHALIKATLAKIKENKGLQDVSDGIILDILKTAILEYADPEIMASLDNFKPDDNDNEEDE